MSALDRLHAVASELDRDEVALLVLLAERLKIGRERSSALHVPTDWRNFTVEALEEATDALVYAAAALMRDGR